MKRQYLRVFVLSALGLALELLLIRWLDSQVRPLAFVKNLALIASFLGLGIGYASASRTFDFTKYTAMLLSFILSIGAVFGSDFGERLAAGPMSPEANLGLRVAGSWFELVWFGVIIAVVFALTVLAMIPLGQLTGRALIGLPTLPAYSVNILGSIAGVLLIFLLASLSMPLWASTAVLGLLLLAYIWEHRSYRVLSVLSLLLAVAAMASIDYRPEQRTVWSAYNKIEVRELPIEDPQGRPVPSGHLLKVQNLFYQQILDLSPQTVAEYGDLEKIRKARYEYDFPYRYKRPKNVLILGAGTGNDVAAALRAGATRVVAVEIDPKISEFGRLLHREKPYSDPRVELVHDDARAYLKERGEQFDMIVFGLLDAHTSFFSSLAGGIRLDNYVYTVESFKQALSRLDQDGMLALSFYVEQPWITSRMGEMMREASGKPALVSQVASNTFTFIAGPGAPAPQPPLTLGIPPQFSKDYPPGPQSTDDWPFIYLRDRMIPSTIWAAALAILLVTFVTVRASFRGGVEFERHFFFLGAGFLLLETRTIAQLALLFGTTWRVSAIAISLVLGLILVANLIIEKTGPLSPRLTYAGLFATLLINTFVRPSSVLGFGQGALIGMTLLLALPLFFAALIFGSSTARRPSLGPILASNLIGSVLGGILENASLIIGISALNLIAIVLYALSYMRDDVRNAADEPLLAAKQ